MTWGDAAERCRQGNSLSEKIYDFIEKNCTKPAPSDVYWLEANDENPFQGDLIFEWRLPGGVIYRVEFDEQGKVNTMTSFPLEYKVDAVFGEFI